MILNINKKVILEEASYNNSGFMTGVNKGFHDSVLPKSAIQSYSNPDLIKNDLKKTDLALSQDLAIRMGSMLAIKGTLGGLVYAGGLKAHEMAAEAYPELELEPGSQSADFGATVPAIAAAWIGADKLLEKLPQAHRKVFKEKSIYKDPNEKQ